MPNKKLMLKPLFVASAVVGLSVLSFLANEARKEIKYLCGNFTPGVLLVDVIRQLDTTELSHYIRETTATGERIAQSSVFHLHTLQCTIEIDRDQQVVKAKYE
jgi:hypothetical protein